MSNMASFDNGYLMTFMYIQWHSEHTEFEIKVFKCVDCLRYK